MKDEEVLKALEDVKQIIVAYRIQAGQLLPDVSNATTCKLCGHDVGALAESIQKAKNKAWMLICDGCLPDVIRVTGPCPYGGRYDTPEQFRKVFP